MKLLDLFCGAGGAAMGYARAGFDVWGVDMELHSDYPFPQKRADAMQVLADPHQLAGWDVIHASPPCPRYSSLRSLHADPDSLPDLVAPTRDALRAWGGPYVIENVPGAPLVFPVLLCGAAFGLKAVCRDGVTRYVRRHRIFETNMPLMSAGCFCGKGPFAGIYGSGGGAADKRAGHSRAYQAFPDESQRLLGIDWMRDREDLADAIPPAYTQHLGDQIRDYLNAQ